MKNIKNENDERIKNKFPWIDTAIFVVVRSIQGQRKRSIVTIFFNVASHFNVTQQIFYLHAIFFCSIH